MFIYYVTYQIIFNTISGAGAFVLGQEQDSVGGSFSEAESLIGRIYRLDTWDYLLDPTKISDLARECQQSFDGSLIKWPDFLSKIRGGVKVKYFSSDFGIYFPNLRGVD